MKFNAWLFTVGAVLFVIAGVIYGLLTGWSELVGVPALLLTGGMSGMLGIYLFLVDRQYKNQPEDRLDAEIEEADPNYGFFSPWSWWPITAAAGAAIVFAGFAVGIWMVPFGFVFAIIGIVGWVYEYSMGNFAH